MVCRRFDHDVVGTAAVVDARFLRRFIEQEIFDYGLECDQEAIYLSIGGLDLYVPQPGTTQD